ncbi:hypothetical protein V1460_15595 [Streptomyces sp. SCSIO 30461]|uniref:hypothetical protein n=1 Tax=Streptomyces sp. SCSIO 30461 TaxID=3118085 RepID=UPI0030CFB908
MRKRTAPLCLATLAIGTALAVTLTAVGCARPTTHHKPGTSHDTATTPVAPATRPPDDSGSDMRDRDDRDSAPSTRTVRITVTGNEVSPAPGRVEVAKGTRVALVVTSDQADELHVHGFDMTTELMPGRARTLSLTADRTGLFAVETHESGLVLTQLVVR